MHYAESALVLETKNALDGWLNLPTGFHRVRIRTTRSGIVKLAGILVILGIAIGTGCSPRTANEGIAGRAFVEDEKGNLVPADDYHSRGTSPAPVRPAGSHEEWLTEFELTERSGKKVSSQDLNGQPYIVSFFFTTCPTICKRQNEKVQILQKQFKNQPIKFVSITCDPEVDNPEVLSIYADQYGADPDQWLFLTGEMDYLRRVGSEMFFVPVDRRFHADKFIFVDRDGNIYRTYEWPDENAWQALLKDIQSMLDAGGRLPAA